MDQAGKAAQGRFMFMLALIMAGEAVYALPFHVARYFRPTVLEVFDLTATQLGAAQGIYGIVAMLMYFPGGPLADRFPARKLLAFSLWTTALGGVYMTGFPGYQGSMILWGFFGITTILFFWAALIRAARDWGGNDAQGRAYGLLDGGRGLLAAALASIGVLIFGLTFPEGYASASFEEKEQALRIVLWGYTGVTALTGVLVWFAIPDIHPSEMNGDKIEAHEPILDHIKEVLKIPAVWMQALIVLCAYVGYKGFDNYSLFAVQAWGIDEVEAAGIVALGSWLRPVAALGAGLLGDRFNVSRMLLISFLILLCSDLFFACFDPIIGAAWILLGNVVIASTAIFALRGLYFAIFEEAKVPAVMTGTAVGFVSIIGYTPDIFVTFVAGLLIDASPGALGHQHFFMFLSVFAGLGAFVSWLLMRRLHPRRLSA
jgi:nitrate/nitrite transporter NarK